MLDALILGEALVDFVPTARGPLGPVRHFEMHRGGASANVAAGLARAGGRAALIGTVGDDPFGRFLLESLGTDGVDIEDVRVVPDERTGLCFITLDRDGERSFVHGGGRADLMLGPEDVRPARAATARTVLFTNGSLRTESGAAAVERLVASAGGLVCCDPGSAPGYGASARLHPLLPRCDVVKCSVDELEASVGCVEPARGAAALVGLGVRLAVVTVGAAGAVWATAESAGRVPAPAVPVVDTTGAGDAFMAALLLPLARDGLPAPAALEGVLRVACEAGAAAVTRRGA